VDTKLIALVGAFSFLLVACAPSVPLATIPARQVETQKITLGSVQLIVKKGASNADVIGALSSPNIVTTNNDGTETWVYDKITSEAEYVQGRSSGVAVQSNRTMIVVIKFDKAGRVETVQYRQTSY
jgi:hypothetical protein